MGHTGWLRSGAWGSAVLAGMIWQHAIETGNLFMVMAAICFSIPCNMAFHGFLNADLYEKSLDKCTHTDEDSGTREV